MIRRNLFVFIACILLSVSLFGCSNTDNKKEPQGAPSTNNSQSTTNAPTSEKVDIDLTKLSGTMIYAEVYNIMTEPEKYIGKTMKIRGIFKSYPAEDPSINYFFVIIPDATACCESGMEFIWSGEHTFPDDYPEVETEIEISGVFSSYQENGNPYFYIKTDEVKVVK